ncbi:hypothetical protein VTK26DRAFT_89 [Humicola hyalothermophila]
MPLMSVVASGLGYYCLFFIVLHVPSLPGIVQTSETRSVQLQRATLRTVPFVPFSDISVKEPWRVNKCLDRCWVFLILVCPKRPIYLAVTWDSGVGLLVRLLYFRLYVACSKKSSQQQPIPVSALLFSHSTGWSQTRVVSQGHDFGSVRLVTRGSKLLLRLNKFPFGHSKIREGEPCDSLVLLRLELF